MDESRGSEALVGGGADADTPLAEVDPHEGGGYRLSMRTDTGDMHTVSGEFKEVQPPERLAYTWAWEEGPEPVMAGSEHTVVVVEFIEDGDGTIVKLTHSGFANEQISAMHAHGWEAVLANLETQVFPTS